MSVTVEEMAEKNLELTKRFILRMLEHPEELESLPDRCTIIDLPLDDPDLFEANLRLAGEIVRNGEKERKDGEPPKPVVLLPIYTREDK